MQALFLCRLLLELLAVLVGRKFGVLAEQPGKEAGVVVADFVADGLDALARSREQALGGFDAQPLQVMQGFVAGGGLEAAHEVANAHAVLAGHVFEAELVGEVFFEPVLDLQDDHILMQFLAAKADASRGVTALHFIEDVPGYGLGDVGPAEALDQVDVQVAGRGGAAGAVEVVGVGQVLVLIELDLGEAFAEGAEEAPVGGGLLAVEQSGFGQPEHAGGLAAEYGAAGVLGTQPGQYLWITLAQGVEVVPERREDDHVSVFQRAVHGHDHIAEAANRLAIGADQAGFEGRGQALAQLFAVAQACQMEEILGLHEGGSENPVDGQDADAPQGRGGLVRHNSIVLIGESGHQTAGSSYFLSDVSSVLCAGLGLGSDGQSRSITTTGGRMIPRTLFSSEHELFRDSVRSFLEKEAVPFHGDWEKQGYIDRQLWSKAGEAGMLCSHIPEQYGGLGADFLYSAVVIEEIGRLGLTGIGFSLHSDIVAPYILHYGSEALKQKYLPRLVSGDMVTAIAMTEPGAGSDLQGVKTTAVLDGDEYVINGSKTFITNGYLAELVIVVAKTDPKAGAKGTSLFLVEADTPGFSKGKRLEKVGMKAQDTSELFFQDVRVPKENLLGQAGMGFAYLMQELPQERLTVAIGGLASAEAALQWTLEYTRERKAFGKAIADFQNTRFKLAEMATEIQIGRVFVDRCLELHLQGKLDVPTAAMAKYWGTDLQCKVLDECVQLHGGYGFMWEYPVARAWADARVQRIYAGTNEIMKEIIARSL